MCFSAAEDKRTREKEKNKRRRRKIEAMWWEGDKKAEDGNTATDIKRHSEAANDDKKHP